MRSEQDRPICSNSEVYGGFRILAENRCAMTLVIGLKEEDEPPPVVWAKYLCI